MRREKQKIMPIIKLTRASIIVRRIQGYCMIDWKVSRAKINFLALMSTSPWAHRKGL